MWSFFKNAGLALVPQPENGEPRHVYQWRQTAAFCIVLMGLTMVFHIAWACGFLISFGLAGFARADEVRTVQQQNSYMMTRAAGDDIREARTQQCLAIGEGNVRAMQYNYTRLESARTAYREITKQEPRVPDCSEIVSAVPAIPIAPSRLAPPPR